MHSATKVLRYEALGISLGDKDSRTKVALQIYLEYVIKWKRVTLTTTTATETETEAAVERREDQRCARSLIIRAERKYMYNPGDFRVSFSLWSQSVNTRMHAWQEPGTRPVAEALVLSDPPATVTIVCMYVRSPPCPS